MAKFVINKPVAIQVLIDAASQIEPCGIPECECHLKRFATMIAIIGFVNREWPGEIVVEDAAMSNQLDDVFNSAPPTKEMH